MGDAASDNTKVLTSAGFSVTVRVKLQNKPGQLVNIVQLLCQEEASVAEVALIYSDFIYNIRGYHD